MVLWYRPRPVGLVEHLRCIIDCLRERFGEHAAKVDRTAGPLVKLIHGRLLRSAARFAALVARFHAGTLPPPRPAPEVDASERALPERALPERTVRVRAPDPLPSGRGWLVRLIQPTAGYSNWLEQMLHDPEMIALLAASPQAGRLLRPMWRMLSFQPYPAPLRPPPPKPRRRLDNAGAGPPVPAGSQRRRASSGMSPGTPGSSDAPRAPRAPRAPKAVRALGSRSPNRA